VRMSRAAWPRLVGHDLTLLWRQALAWAALFGVTAAAVVRAFVAGYPTEADRLRFAQVVGLNPGFQAINGVARNLDTVGGFTAWRFGGPFAVVAAAWGLLAATRLLRGEEEAGRAELLLTGRIRGGGLVLAGLGALAAVFGAVAVVIGVALAAASVPSPGAFVIGAQVMLGAAMFAGVGALASQLFPARRTAATWSAVLLGASFLLRVVADGTRTLGWLRWWTPLGWLENLRPFAGTHLVALVPVVALLVATTCGSVLAVRRRNLGDGLVGTRVRARPASALERTLPGFVARSVRGVVAAWAAGLAVACFVTGLLAKDIADFVRTSDVFQKLAAELGAQKLDRPEGYLGVVLSFVAVPVAVMAATQVAACREEESSGRLDNLLVLPVGRRQWIATRVVAVVVAVTTVALVAGLSGWLGAAALHAGVAFKDMAAGGLNMVPVALLFLGFGVLAFGALPRLTAPLTIGLVLGLYMLQLVGSLAKFPSWVLDLSPFHHVAPAPATPVNGLAAAVMIALGAVTVVAGVAAFARRDVTGA